jgi:hypothetical protein
MKIHTVVAEFFHADGQTYITKLIVAFGNFANAAKKAGGWIFKAFLFVHNTHLNISLYRSTVTKSSSIIIDVC